MSKVQTKSTPKSTAAGVDLSKLFPKSVKHTFSRSAVYARNGMVAASQPLACDAGISILKKGGNAVDAAIAVAGALAVTEPCSTGIGGDAFLLYYHAQTGKVYSLNGSGRSAMNGTIEDIKKAFPNHFQQQSLSMNSNKSDVWPDVTHGLTVTVPGASMAWGDAVEKWGTMKLSDVLQPAINIATNGFPVSPKTATFWDLGSGKLKKSKYGKDMLMKNGIDAPGAGEIFQNIHLAQCLKEIGEHGPRKAVYEGRIGQEIVNIVQARGGNLTMDDFRRHTTSFPDPVRTNYRGIDVYEHPPNGQGLCALLGLNVLKESPLKNGVAPHNSSLRLHYQIEAMRLAFADGRHYITDMDSKNPTPIDELLSEKYTEKRRKLINPKKATIDVKHGSPLSSSDTVSFQVVDKYGNAVSMVNSNYQGFGTGIVPRDCGFTLQNRGANFSLQKDHFNVYAPNKRPYHTIIPGMCVIPKESLLKTPGLLNNNNNNNNNSTNRLVDQLYCTFTNMGGFMQPQGHVQILSNLLDYGMDPQDALDSPRFCIADGHADGRVYFEDGISEEIVNELIAMGHVTGREIIRNEGRSLFGRAQIIMRDPRNGVLRAGSDGRSDGMAQGY